MLQSLGPNGATEYELHDRLDAPNEDIYFAERIAPIELRGPVLVKHASRTKANFPYLKEKLFDEAVDNASFLHPNLTAVADIIENDAGMYLIFENVAGTDLDSVQAKLSERGRAMSIVLATHVCIEMLRGIHHLHTTRGPNGERRATVAREITPSTVLLSTQGHVKIANRGLASALRHIRKPRKFDRFAYYAPERIAGDSSTVRTDLFAVGVMLWELLVGRPCFEGNTSEDVLSQILNRGVPLADLAMIGVPPALSRAVEAATTTLPEQRFASAVEMAQMLEGALQASALSAPTRTLARFLELYDLANEGAAIGSGAAKPATEETPGKALMRTADLKTTPSVHEMASMARSPLFTAVFGMTPPLMEETKRFAAIVRDGLDEVEARALALRAVAPPAPSSPRPANRPANSQPAWQPSAPQPAWAGAGAIAAPATFAQQRLSAPGRMPSDLHPPKKRWRETTLIVLLALGMLLLGMMLAGGENDSDLGSEVEELFEG